MTHLATHYAPGSFLKPCLIVDTVYTTGCAETALVFVEALNVDHATELVYSRQKQIGDPHLKKSEWIPIQQHATREEAVAFHLDLTKDFHNGGSQEEWDQGWEPYLAIYARWCPPALRDRLDRADDS